VQFRFLTLSYKVVVLLQDDINFKSSSQQHWQPLFCEQQQGQQPAHVNGQQYGVHQLYPIETQQLAPRAEEFELIHYASNFFRTLHARSLQFKLIRYFSHWSRTLPLEIQIAAIGLYSMMQGNSK
jgi:hypothetical protein